MSCNRDGEQLELQLGPDALFRRFHESVTGIIREYGLSEALRYELRNWAEFHDFEVMASWTRRSLREIDLQDACILLEGFGITFRGDEVGHIGRDLLTRPLASPNLSFRTAAVGVLARWLEYDEDNLWLDMADMHIDREEDEDLRVMLQDAVAAWEDQMLKGMMVEEGVQEELPFPDEEDELEEPVNPLLEEYFEVQRACECELRGTFPRGRVGPILSKLTGMPEHLMAGVMEMLLPFMDVNKILQRKPGAEMLGIYTTNRSVGDWDPDAPLRHLRIWDTNGSFAFSLEPTATPDRVLMFCYVR